MKAHRMTSLESNTSAKTPRMPDPVNMKRVGGGFIAPTHPHLAKMPNKTARR